MKKITLHQPKFEELAFRQTLLADEKTMDYNAGYHLDFPEYHIETGCIDFPKNKWKTFLNKIQKPNFFYAYIKDIEKNIFVGEINFNLDEKTRVATFGIVIKHEFRGQGYMKPAITLLFEEAKRRNVKILRDTVPETRKRALQSFYDLGFKKTGEFLQQKFNTTEKVIIINYMMLPCSLKLANQVTDATA